MNLPDYVETHFPNAPLKRVVCQVKFPTILLIAPGSALVAEFQQEIRDEYPFLQEMQQLAIEISGPVPSVPRATTQAAWQFADRDKRWIVTLAQDALTLETERYSSFEDLSRRMTSLLDALVRRIRPGFRTRLGLRYINEIASAGVTVESWRELLNAQWRSVMATDVFGPTVSNWLQNVRVVGDDGVFNVNVGFLSEDTPRVVIDLDYFDEAQHEFGGEETMQTLDRWHNVIHSMFRWSISDVLTTQLRGA